MLYRLVTKFGEHSFESSPEQAAGIKLIPGDRLDILLNGEWQTVARG